MSLIGASKPRGRRTGAIPVAVASVLSLGLLAPGSGAAESIPDPAVIVVAELHAALAAVMREADALGFEGRRERLDPILRARFDFPFMARNAVGRYWRELADAQRTELVAALSELAISTYAARFSGFDGERFETLGREEASHETVMVKTRIVPGSGDEIPLDYRLRQDVNGRWRIIDVFLNGTVSELALRRAEYSSVIKRDGFPALLTALGERASEQAAAASN